MAFRAWHRGTREMDLILGRFADAELAGFDQTDLDLFEALLEWPDPDLYDWVTGETRPPAVVDSPLFARLRAFHNRAGWLHG